MQGLQAFLARHELAHILELRSIERKKLTLDDGMETSLWIVGSCEYTALLD